MAIAPEVAAEYQALTEGGEAAGATTLRKAETNVAARRAASSTPAAKPTPSAGGQPAVQRRIGEFESHPAAYVATGGPTGDDIRQAAVRVGAAVSSPSKTAQTLTRLVWAVALGLIVLEVASEATGQFWDFRLPASGSLKKQPYQPLYAGQDLMIADQQQQAQAQALAGLGVVLGSPGRSGTPGAVPLGVARA